MPRTSNTSTTVRTTELSIGRLAKDAQTSTATVHFYVSEGLLPPPRKINRTRAAYSAEHLRRLRLVRRMQNIGYSLAQVKKMFEHYGTSDAALTKMEQVGSLQPLPQPKTAADQRPIELFEPVDRHEFLRRAGCSSDLLAALIARGYLRPLRPDRFDARDLWQVRTIDSMLQDGIALDELGLLDDLLRAARAAGPLILRRIARHVPELRTRQLRYTDLVEPLNVSIGYLIDRLLTENDPDWRQAMTGP